MQHARWRSRFTTMHTSVPSYALLARHARLLTLTLPLLRLHACIAGTSISRAKASLDERRATLSPPHPGHDGAITIHTVGHRNGHDQTTRLSRSHSDYSTSIEQTLGGASPHASRSEGLSLTSCRPSYLTTLQPPRLPRSWLRPACRASAIWQHAVSSVPVMHL